MYLYIPDFSQQLIELANLDKKINSDMKIKKSSQDSVDFMEYIKFVEKYQNLLFEMQMQMVHWKNIFESPQTISEKSLAENQKYLQEINTAKNKIVSQCILNNFFLN